MYWAISLSPCCLQGQIIIKCLSLVGANISAKHYPVTLKTSGICIAVTIPETLYICSFNPYSSNRKIFIRNWDRITQFKCLPRFLDMFKNPLLALSDDLLSSLLGIRINKKEERVSDRYGLSYFSSKKSFLFFKKGNSLLEHIPCFLFSYGDGKTESQDSRKTTPAHDESGTTKVISISATLSW